MKKGFTLIEVIAAIAIFSIAFVAVSLAFSIAITTGQGNEISQNNIQFSETIIEKFRTSYDFSSIGSNGVSYNIYFNSIGDLEDGINEMISGTADTNPLKNGHAFGALISISKVQVVDVTTYHIYVKSWRLDKGSKYQSIKDFYESR